MTIGKPLPEGEDQSAIPKFPVQSLVIMPIGKVGMVENSQNVHFGGDTYNMLYDIRYGLYSGRTDVIHGILERALKPITWRQFIWHRSPTTGWMNIGKWNAIGIIITLLAVAVLMLQMAITDMGWWTLAPLVIPVLLVIGAVRNFHNKRM